MADLRVDIERDGVMRRVGFICGNDAADSRFSYSGEYLNSSDAAPISISLPLQSDAFSPAQTKNFFEGLLPEGFTRRTVAQWMHADESDYLSILHGLGKECIGALCISGEGDDRAAAYEPLTGDDIYRLAAEGATISSEFVTRSHLSLAGATGKAGLYCDIENGGWYLPRGTAPSTHIFKQSHVRLENIVINEQLALMAAHNCGIPAVNSSIFNLGSGKDGEVLFATTRYDRVISHDSDRIDGMLRPLRLHQEDFSQALGISSAEKYEKEPRGYLRRMFEVLRRYSADPVQDQLRLWDMLIFNYLIGNTDCHIKNFSLLYSPNLKSVRLAPAYDLLSTAVYSQSTREMPFFIGNKLSLDEIDRDSFKEAAHEIGLGEKMAMRHFDVLCRRFGTSLMLAAGELCSMGFKQAAALEEKISEAGGIKNFE